MAPGEEIPGHGSEVVAFARQAILDERGRVFGYEVLHAGGHGLSGLAADQAVARMLLEADPEWLRSLTAGHPIFVKFGRDLLVGGAGALLPPSLLIIELQPGTEVDPELDRACSVLADAGYALGVDSLDAGRASMHQILQHVRFVKVDAGRTTPAYRAELRTRLLPHAPRLIAAHVDTPEMAAEVRASGIRLLQGRFFSVPTCDTRTSLAQRQIDSLRLLGEMQTADLSMEALEGIIKRDVTLTWRVLRSINSSAYAIRREVSSIRQALMMLGLEQVRRWAWVWVLAGVSQGAPSEALASALIRGRFCELASGSLADTSLRASAFLLGLCSTLDVLLGVPMTAIVSELPLPAIARDALVGRPNPARTLLDCAAAWERGAWADAGRLATQLGVLPASLPTFYHESVEWAPALQEMRQSA